MSFSRLSPSNGPGYNEADLLKEIGFGKHGRTHSARRT